MSSQRTQAQFIEEAAQALAAWLGEDFGAISMVDHYLGREAPASERATEIVALAVDLLNPALEALREADVDRALKDHQLASRRSEFTAFADFVRSIPDRMPEIGTPHDSLAFQAWLKRELSQAPTGRTERAAQ
jgi:hypothetical protein